MDQPKPAAVTVNSAPGAAPVAPASAQRPAPAPAQAAPQTPSAAIVAIAAAADQASTSDSRGRVIAVRKLGPLLKTRLLKLMGPDNARNMPVVGYYSMAASVTAIDGEPVAFPIKDIHVEALLDRLGDEGLEAIGKCWKENGWVPSEDDDKAEGNAAAIKN